MKMKWNIRRQLSCAALFCAILPQTSHAVIITKAANANALNLGTSWVGGVVPGPSDLMLWDSTYTAVAQTSLPLISADMSVDGILVTNPGGAANTANVIAGARWDNTTRKLTIGASGVAMSAATKAIRFDTSVFLGANQTWNIANANTAANPAGLNNGEDLSFVAPGLTDFDLNGKTLTVTGAGQVTLSSGYTVTNGTLKVENNLFVIQGGTSRLTTIASSLSTTVAAGSQLRLQSNSGAITSASPITTTGTLRLLNNNAGQPVTQSGALTMNAGSILETSMAQAGVITISGEIAASGAFTWNTTGTLAHANGIACTGNLTGSGNILYQHTNSAATSAVRLSGNNSAYAGMFTINGATGTRALRLSSATAGSAAATWNVAANNVLQVDGVSVQLGTLTGAGSVTNSHATNAATINVGSGLFSGVISNGAAATGLTKTGAGTLTLSGVDTYTGATTVSAGTLGISTLGTGATPVTIADGASLRLDVAAQDSQRTLPSVTMGATTGASLLYNFGSLGNPTLAPLVATALNVDAASTIELIGRNLAPGTFPVVSYGAMGGSLGYSGLTLKLPPRVSGSMANNTTNSTIDVTITAVEGIRWKGSVDNNWDVDPTGAGAVGTPNWQTTVTNATTRFLQGSAGTDAALFDDNAAGTGAVTVNLTTAHSPTALVFNNSTRDYTLQGSGSLTGVTALEKNGAASLQLSNTIANTFTGGTELNEGTLILGDGVTPGAGVIIGAIDNLLGTTLVLNRPDDHSFTNTLTGVGLLKKNSANTLTLPSAFVYDGDVELVAGNTIFSNGGELRGKLAGDGDIVVSTGVLRMSGSSALANTHTGDITLPGTSVLRLEKDADTQAVGGNVYVTGSANGQLLAIGNNQFSSNATLHFLGSSGDPMVGSTGSVTVKDVVLNTNNGVAGQLVMKAVFNILGKATVQSGIFGAGSGTIATVNEINIVNPVGTIVRVAGNSAATTMNIGAGGLTAAGGEMQVKFNTSDMDAIVNLGGNVTTTGNFIISNGGYTGANRNVLNLTGTRTFSIAENTTTSVSPDFADDATLTADLEDSFTGNLVKDGAGKLVLNSLCNVGHSGTTSVLAGSLIVNGTMPIQAPTLAAGALLGGNGTITAATTIPSGATISPGDGTAATLNFISDVTLASGSTYAVDITGASAVDRISAPAATLSAGGTIAVTLTAFVPVADQVFDIADANSITGTPTFDFTAATLSSGLAWDTTAFTTDGTIKVVSVATGYDVFAQSITNPDDRDPLDDADRDGISNLLEYVLGGVPSVASQTILPNSSVSATELVFSFKRSDASEVDTTQVVEVSSDLSNWSTVIPVTAASGGNVTVVENGAADDDVTITIAKGANTELFAHLKVTKP